MLDLAKYVKVGLAATSLYMLSAAAFLGATVDNELVLNAGWRNDEVTRRFHDTDTGAVDSSIHDKLKVKDANLWQIGVCGIFSAPDCFCDCGTEWLSRFYARGYAYYGWYTDGKFHNRFHDNNGNSVSGGRRHHKVNDGHAQDYSIGVGFQWPVTCEFSIGPVGGYAWDEQVFKAKRHHHHHSSSSSSSFFPPESSSSSSSFLFPSSSSSSSSSSSISSSSIPALAADNVAQASSSFDGDGRRRHVKSQWRGGWVGFDAMWKFCDWDIAFGYEYHFAQFRGGHNRHDSTSVVPPVVGSSSSSSNHRHHRSKNGHGNVAWIDGRWNLCDCWDLVVGFKYQNYQAKRRAEWTAYGVTAGLGWRF